MRGHLLKPLLSLMFVGSLLTMMIWYTLDNNNVEPNPQQTKTEPQSSASCKDCREDIKKALELYSQTWKKQEDSYQNFSVMVFAESNCVVLSLLCAGGCVWRAAGEQLLPICSSVVRGFKERWDNSSVPDDTQHWETSPPPTKPPSAARKLTGFQPCLPVPSLTPDRLLSNPHLPTRTPPTLVLSSQPHLTLALPAQPAVTCLPLSALPTTRKLSLLNRKCKCFDKAIITQKNTPLGSKLVYDGERKRTLQVNQEIFNTFPKGYPFSNKTLHTCAVVGNGGILANSSCGKMIDSAEFVIRCNLPPLSNGYEKHVGIKTHLVTANPSILMEKYAALMARRRPFVENLRSYGDSMLLLPAFSYGRNTPVSLRAFYTLEDFESPIQSIFFNPAYLRNLAFFWRSQGLKAVRLSTGIIVTSLALEICENVHLYGFWPFGVHPYSSQDLTNHYYDDRKTKIKFHAMPDEFNLLLNLHSQGVLKMHLGDCEPDEKRFHRSD